MFSLLGFCLPLDLRHWLLCRLYPLGLIRLRGRLLREVLLLDRQLAGLMFRQRLHRGLVRLLLLGREVGLDRLQGCLLHLLGLINTGDRHEGEIRFMALHS